MGVSGCTCNPSYSGGRDQKHGVKAAWANSSRDPISKILSTKKDLWSGSSDRLPA
jgi:hypothetical protein